MRHMFYGSFDTQKSMVIFIFTSGQVKVKSGSILRSRSGQKRSKFKVGSFELKMCLSNSDFYEESNGAIFIYPGCTVRPKKKYSKFLYPGFLEVLGRYHSHFWEFFGEILAQYSQINF